MSIRKETEGTSQHSQSPCAALWNALGLTFQQAGLQSSLDEADVGAATEKHMPLDYDVFFGYRPEGHADLTGDSRNGRQHTRHPIGYRFQFRFDSVRSCGQGVLQNISVSGAAIGVYRKLTVDQAIVMMVNLPDLEKLPIAVRLTVVRDAGATDEGLHIYGCRIDVVSNPNAQT